MPREVVTAPTLLPVTVSEAASWARVLDPADNSTIERLIKSARDQAQERTGRTLLTTVYDLKLPAFPSGQIDLPGPPVASVASVTYYDQSNTLQTLVVGTDYVAYCGELDGIVYLPSGRCWPSTYDRPDAVVVRYTAGRTSPDLLLSSTCEWILAYVATSYENREQIITGTIVSPLPRDFLDGKLDPERILSAY